MRPWLSLWDLPPADLAVLLYQMTETGTGGAAYYADILAAVLSVPSTHDKADILPLSSPHSKSSQPRFSRPYFSSISAAFLLACSRISCCPSRSCSSPDSSLLEPDLVAVPPDLVP